MTNKKSATPPKYDASRGGTAKHIRYRADFLWKHEEGSVEEAGYEFANARTEEYRQQWWKILLKRAAKIIPPRFPLTHR